MIKWELGFTVLTCEAQPVRIRIILVRAGLSLRDLMLCHEHVTMCQCKAQEDLIMMCVTHRYSFNPMVGKPGSDDGYGPNIVTPLIDCTSTKRHSSMKGGVS